MQEFVSKYTYINAGTVQAILKFKIVRDNYKFKVIFELYELHIKNDQVEMCSLIEKQCNQINSQVLEKFNNDLKGSIILDYYNVESYLPILKNMIIQIQDTNRYNIILYNQLQVILTKVELIRIYNDLESFYKNHMLLETCLRMVVVSDEKEKIPEVVKVCNYKKENIVDTTSKPKDNSNLLFQLCVSDKLKQLLIFQLLNYYMFLPLDKIKIENDIVYIPNLFSSVLFNKQYNSSLLFSLVDVDVNDLKIVISKILKNLKDNKLDNVMIIGVSFLLYFYILRLVYDTHTSYILNNLEEVFKDNVIQEKLLNSQINIYFKEITIQFDITNINLGSIELDNIDELSKKYNYLKIVDQEDFTDKIFNTINDNKGVLKVNNYTVLDLDNLKYCKIDLDDLDIFNTSDIAANQSPQLLLQYQKKDNQLRTYCLDMFDVFINDSHKFYLLKSKNSINLPVTVLNLFPELSSILKTINKHAKLDNTLTYYDLLIKELFDAFLPSTLLYIIFQLFVPYMYNNYAIYVFNDCLL